MSKILIFSKNNDFSTNSVIDWILKEGEGFIRINGESFLYEDKSKRFGEQLASDVGHPAITDTIIKKNRTND